MNIPTEAIRQLRNSQDQLDMDGCRVGVSRQALDEVLAFVEYGGDLPTPDKDFNIPVSEVADRILNLIPITSENSDIREHLKEFREGLFLELPEERIYLLKQVTRIINQSIPENRTGDYWLRVRDLVLAEFSSIK